MSRCWLSAFNLLLIISMAPAQADSSLVRLAVVNTPYQSGLLQTLISGFEAQSRYQVSIYSGHDVFEQARQGQADLLIAHYGKKPMQDFVLSGLGSWPQMVFANQQVLVGPSSDPAGIEGMTSAAAALNQIAEKEQPFVMNQISGVTALFDLIWQQAGKPDKTGWLIDEGLAKGQAMKQAVRLGAYTLWGADPFIRFSQKQRLDLKILVSADPLLQRVMAISLVNPEKQTTVNAEGASALRDYLLSAPVQAKVSQFRQPGYAGQLWWPAARHN
jgi:tungstate transport system substrate-binding protein